MSARQRCIIQGCESWEFDKQCHMCRNCSIQYSQIADTLKKYQKSPTLKAGLIVTQPIVSPYYLGVQAGERVDVIDILSDGSSVIIKDAKGTVGYFNIDFLSTEDEIAQNFLAEEESRKEQEEREAKEAARRAEEEYEAHLREKMRLKAVEERERRALEAEQRRIEQEEMMRQIEQMKLEEAERNRRIEEERLRRKQLEEERKQREQAEREALAREEKRIWDQQQQQYREQKMFDKLPQWKKDLIMRQQNQ